MPSHAGATGRKRCRRLSPYFPRPSGDCLEPVARVLDLGRLDRRGAREQPESGDASVLARVELQATASTRRTAFCRFARTPCYRGGEITERDALLGLERLPGPHDVHADAVL